MIVVFGANGKTGIEVVREAKKRGLEVRPVAKNDHDTYRLEKVVNVNEIAFANADHIEAIRAVIQGATSIVSCIDSRTAGFGSPVYTPDAGANIIKVAHENNIQRMLHVCVMGGYRSSPNPLNKRTFHMDILIRRLKVPWTMLRVSCYHDEIIDGHVNPPDGGKPRHFRPSSRYSPVSRQDTGRVICNLMPDLIPNRTWLLGGPKVFSGENLETVLNPYRTAGSGNSVYGGLPHGDFSVATDNTEIMVGWIPTETLEWYLDPKTHPLPPTNTPFWNRPTPDPHWSDIAKDVPILQSMDSGLRYALHEQLMNDIEIRLKTEADLEKASLDFRSASILNDIPLQTIYGVPMQAFANVQVNLEKTTLYNGSVAFIYDELADDLQIWWSEENPIEIPEHVWDRLDLGIRRRLIDHPIWQQSSKVRNYAAERHERVQL